MKKAFLLFISLLFIASVFAQSINKGNLADSFSIARRELREEFKLKSNLVSITFLSYGLLRNNIKPIRKLDISTRDEIVSDHLKYRTGVGDYIQWAPTISLFAFDAAGLKTAHKVKEQMAVHLMSTFLLTASVHTLKRLSNTFRPDSSARNSFPSGHTATAFAGAEMVHQELKATHPLLSYSGYFFATATGISRVCNNRHWLSDVVAGAGLGILTTKASYWIFHKIKRRRQQRSITAN